jgi:hypothetical protein
VALGCKIGGNQKLTVGATGLLWKYVWAICNNKDLTVAEHRFVKALVWYERGLAATGAVVPFRSWSSGYNCLSKPAHSAGYANIYTYTLSHFLGITRSFCKQAKNSISRRLSTRVGRLWFAITQTLVLWFRSCMHVVVPPFFNHWQGGIDLTLLTLSRAFHQWDQIKMRLARRILNVYCDEIIQQTDNDKQMRDTVKLYNNRRSDEHPVRPCEWNAECPFRD